MYSKMWDFLPMERDEYVSAEDDAIRVEQARERARARGANPSDGICPVCDMTISECGGEKAHEDKAEREHNTYCPYCDLTVDECRCDEKPLKEIDRHDIEEDIAAQREPADERGPEFAQEYESPEDIYAEQEAGEDW